jgi:signal transduction histidine kinase
MPNGGKIDLSVERKAITEPNEHHAASGNYVCITIKDGGVGIAEEKYKEIFKPFFTSSNDGNGTGLGLSVCQGIISEHDGWIGVTSEVGKGSSFTVNLPEQHRV